MKRTRIKHKGIRQTVLTKSAKGQDCTLNVAGVCSYDSETVVLAHIDSEFKGMAKKSPDHFAVFACAACHRWMDQHIGSEEDRLYYSLRALGRTWEYWISTGVIKL